MASPLKVGERGAGTSRIDLLMELKVSQVIGNWNLVGYWFSMSRLISLREKGGRKCFLVAEIF